MINSPLVAVGIGDATGRITEVNDAFVQLLGYSREELLSGTVTWRDLTPPEYTDLDHHCMEELERNGKFGPYEKENIRKDGTRVPILVGAARLPGAVVEHVAFIVDITQRKQGEEERRRLEAQILHAQKLESLGILAGGIAHDFNNILAGIMGYADLALVRLPTSEPAREDIEVIKKAVKRAADLTRQMLAYSGKGTFVIESVSLSRIVEDARKMLEVSVSKKAALKYNLASDLPAIQADASQIHQVILNFVINASEALGEHSGIIAISTDTIPCDAADFADIAIGNDLQEGRYVRLEVADTGCGMDQQTLAKIFDPFFTTKFTGRGLGLAAVQGIVRGHRGAIRVASKPGKGATFQVLFPASGPPLPLSAGQSIAANPDAAMGPC